MNNKQVRSTIAIIVTVIIWGFSFLSIKVTINVLPPMTLALLRFIMASFVLAVVFKRKEPETKLKKNDIPTMIWGGIFGVSLYFYFENNSIKYISASAASILVATIPVITILAEAIFLRNPMNGRKSISVLLSILGVYYVVGGNFTELLTSGTGMGYGMMLGAVFAWVAYTIITKPLFEKYSQLAIVYYQTVFGTAALFPFVFLEKTPWHLVSGSIILNVLYLGIFCSALAYYLYAFSMDALGVTVTSVYLNLIPVVTVIASFIILKEKIHLNQVFGGMLVIAAVTLANWQKVQKHEIVNQDTAACIK